MHEGNIQMASRDDMPIQTERRMDGSSRASALPRRLCHIRHRIRHRIFSSIVLPCRNVVLLGWSFGELVIFWPVDEGVSLLRSTPLLCLMRHPDARNVMLFHVRFGVSSGRRGVAALEWTSSAAHSFSKRSRPSLKHFRYGD